MCLGSWFSIHYEIVSCDGFLLQELECKEQTFGGHLLAFECFVPILDFVGGLISIV